MAVNTDELAPISTVPETVELKLALDVNLDCIVVFVGITKSGGVLVNAPPSILTSKLASPDSVTGYVPALPELGHHVLDA